MAPLYVNGAITVTPRTLVRLTDIMALRGLTAASSSEQARGSAADTAIAAMAIVPDIVAATDVQAMALVAGLPAAVQ